MERVLGQMSPDEQQLYQIYQGRLKNDLCTSNEKKDAQQQIDILEQKGVVGEALATIQDFEKRLTALELIKGRGKAAFTKTMFDTLITDFHRLEDEMKLVVVLTERITTNREEITGLWADLRKNIEGQKIAAETLSSTQKSMQNLREKNDVKFKALEADNRKILAALGDVVSNAVEEAKVAIAAEAQAAAVAAVSELVGSTSGS